MVGPVLLIFLAMVVALTVMGQPLWCACGSWAPWSDDIHSAHNSQHLVDPYFFTHILHGVLFYAVIRLLWPRMALARRFWLALGLEALWELFENSDMVVERFRQTTVSLHYHGDSIANSVGDLLACAAGFGAAASLPVWGSVALVLVTELMLYVWIKDSLFLVIWALIFPEKPQ
ncbi:DUF2585 family protein [bacterium CPR1]|nr:DUF2585 family protein [bacterium CPR1]